MGLLIHILPYVLVIPLITGLIYLRQLPKAGKIFLAIIASYLVVEVISYTMAKIFGNNMIVYYIYVPALMALYGYFYYNSVRSPWAQRSITIITLMAIAVPIAETLFATKLFMNSISLGVISVAIFAFSLYLFYEMALNQVDHKSYWVNIFTFFYFFVSAGYFIAARYLQRNDMEAMILMGNMHAVVNTLCYIGYAYGLKTYAR